MQGLDYPFLHLHAAPSLWPGSFWNDRSCVCREAILRPVVTWTGTLGGAGMSSIGEATSPLNIGQGAG